MIFTMKIDSNNVGCETKAQVAKLIREVANKVLNGERSSGKILDENGNCVGAWVLEKS